MNALPIVAAAAVLAAGCAALFEPDRRARAPQLAGFGSATLRASTGSDAAQSLFAQGMQQAYAFNAPEAVRAFKAALAADPRCALCAWGVAWQLGPNINAPQRGDLADTRRHAALALRLAPAATPFEQALIDAMAVRYGSGDTAAILHDGPGAGDVCAGPSGDRAHPLDVAYAERLRGIADALPLQPDVVALYAEAEMIASDWPWWDDASGRATGRIGTVVDRIERALPANADHTGLNHYLIHATDAVAAAARAVPAADRLGALAPASPHLVHMSAHTYIHVGRYADASRVNQQALAAEVALTAALAAQDTKPLHNWDGHNLHFLWFAALMEGRGDLALATARRSAEHAAGRDSAYAEYRRALPILTLLRLQRWDDVLRAPLPAGDHGFGAALGTAAHGIALARTGQPAAARDRQAAVRQALAKADADLRPLLATVAGWLQAELALADGRIADARDALQQAARDEDAMGGEPPVLGAASRIALGDVLLRQRDWAAAEATYREALRRNPGNGWALRGLVAALAGAERAADARQAQQQLAAAWPQADAALLR